MHVTGVIAKGISYVNCYRTSQRLPRRRATVAVTQVTGAVTVATSAQAVLVTMLAMVTALATP